MKIVSLLNSIWVKRFSSNRTNLLLIHRMVDKRYRSNSVSTYDSSNINSVLSSWPGSYRVILNDLLRDIIVDKPTENLAKSMDIDTETWISYVATYRRQLMKKPLDVFESVNQLMEIVQIIDNVVIIPSNSTQLVEIVDENETVNNNMKNDLEVSYDPEMYNECKNLLVTAILKSAQHKLVDERAAYRELCLKSDLRVPHEWYSLARIMKRKIIYHGGPTNSGKTHQALERLRQADPAKGGGLFCGPLRLLALEVYERLNREGVYCDLMTGQEQRQVPFSSHISCTVEMVNIFREYDVAVIDEIQMVADQQRGYAWTRALHGLRAREIHVCGGIEASSIVRAFAADIGDDFELREYKRLSSLVPQETSLRGDYSKIRPGDCVVAFSRADIFSIKREIERLTPYKCCMIYGQLPPETRSTQARLFNENDSGFDVLVASDAIGMGLNLNIRRIIFHSVVKRGGANEGSYWVDPSAVKQIGGRAGRLSSDYKVGEVTAWQDEDLAYVRACMSYDLPQISKVGLFPSLEQIGMFSDQLHMAADAAEKSREVDDKQIKLSMLLQKFVQLAQMDGRYFLCEHQDLMAVSNWLHSIPLSLADRFLFSSAPVSTRDRVSMNLLYQFAATYAQNRPVALNVRLPIHRPKDVIDLSDLCMKHNVLDLYLWLSIRFPKYFIERDLCLKQKEYAIKMIDDSLRSSSLSQKFCYVEEYRSVRKSLELKARSSRTYWPEKYPTVAKAAQQFLEATPPEFRFVVPPRQQSRPTSSPTRPNQQWSRSTSSGGSGSASAGKRPLVRTSMNYKR